MRFSYGEGGYDGTTGFLYISEYSNWSTYQLGTAESRSNIYTIRESEAANLVARWERSIKKSLGFDLGMFNNSLTCSVDFFDEYRDGILMSRNSVSDIFG
jgi:hypothetical protein